MRFLLLLFVLVGCQTVSTHRFDTPRGPVVCRQVRVEHCGLALLSCGVNATEDFYCMSDVHYVSPWTGPLVPADYAPVMQEDTE